MIEVYLIFDESHVWFRHFLKKGFGHVLLCIKKDNELIFVNPHFNACEINVLKCRKNAPINNVFDLDKYKVIKICAEPVPQLFSHPLFGIFTCVRFIKYMLGIKMFTYSPYHFYKRLLKLSKRDIKAMKKHRIVLIEDINHGFTSTGANITKHHGKRSCGSKAKSCRSPNEKTGNGSEKKA